MASTLTAMGMGASKGASSNLRSPAEIERRFQIGAEAQTFILDDT
jgi:hypothetical protein